VDRQLDLEFPGEPASVARARHAVAHLARELGAPVNGVRLAVSEAVTNAVLHGYRGEQSGMVQVQAGVERGRLVCVVRDFGVGMSPNPDSPGLGLGLPLIGRVADDLRIEGDPGETVVSFAFPIPVPAP
jgi:serine/threonine-protein kinase RsbW/stage II sporulation protein AB (anti-sigma F factor)